MIRVVGLLANLVAMAFIFARTELFFTQLILLLVLFFQVFDLVRLVNRTNQELSRFILAIKHGDYSARFHENHPDHTSLGNLLRSFDTLMGSFKEMERQKASQFLFFQRIIEGVNTGIIALSADKKMVLANQAAQHLLTMPGLSSWTHLQAGKPVFTAAIEALNGMGRGLVELSDTGETRQLSVGADSVVVLGETYLIITLQDIRSEIEQKEIEAWHKLIRILSHEIMNSVTPVVSLTETMLMILEEEEAISKKPSHLTEDNLSDLRLSLETIRKRSQGLLNFIHDYRRLTHLPVPRMESVNVGELIKNTARLMQAEIRSREIAVLTEVPDPALSILADAKLIEQILINLLINSMQAMEAISHPCIELSAYQRDDQVIIAVSDNGPGIDADKLEKVFIPFYSTKENGSGIGLSLSRQLMKLHEGTIRVSSEQGVKTSFQLLFRKIQTVETHDKTSL